MIKPNKSILAFVILIILTGLVHADGWTSSNPSHSTLYSDTITSKTEGSSVNIADLQGLFVTGDITTLGNVGIGTTSPNAKLEISGGGIILPNSGAGPTSSSLAFRRNDNSIIESLYITNADKLYSRSSAGWGFIDTGNNERVTITTSGNVGIGTTSPSAELHVLSSTSPDFKLEDTSVSGKALTMVQGGNLGFYEGGGIYFDVNGDTTGDAFVITSAGNVGIGTTAPGSLLTVAGTARFADDGAKGIFIRGSHAVGAVNWQIGQDINVANALEITPSTADGGTTFSTPAIVFKNSGNVGIGTTTPANALDVGGSSSGAVRIDGRGAFFLAAEAACLATGDGDRFLVWSAGTSQNCNQACSAIVCGAAASCVQGWTVWSGSTHYRYGPECTSSDPSGGQGISGKLCCCTGTGCGQNMYR